MASSPDPTEHRMDGLATPPRRGRAIDRMSRLARARRRLSVGSEEEKPKIKLAKYLQRAAGGGVAVKTPQDDAVEEDQFDALYDIDISDEPQATTDAAFIRFEEASAVTRTDASASRVAASLEAAEIAESQKIAFEFPSRSHPIESLTIDELSLRLDALVLILSDFLSRRPEPNRSFSEYVNVFQRYLMLRYGYNEFLATRIVRLYSPAEARSFMEASERPRPMTLRCNTLKTKMATLRTALGRRGMNLKAVSWCGEAAIISDATSSPSSTPEHLVGHFMLQSAASMLPVLALDLQPGHRVLDMCAAPGGKTTHMAQVMRNKGIIFANDISKDRLVALKANVCRLGVQNVVVTNESGDLIAKQIGGFDRILVDAPCTGTGVIARDPSIKVTKQIKDLHQLQRSQERLLEAAIDALKVGGIVVYSTCSILVEENELVVHRVLERRPEASVLPTGLAFGAPGKTKFRDGEVFLKLNDALAHARRYTPHQFNLDGFFVAKIRKRRQGTRDATKAASQTGGPKKAKENKSGGKKQIAKANKVVGKKPITKAAGKKTIRKEVS